MNMKDRARELADTFVNGIFSGHAELYRDELREFLAKALEATRREALEEAAIKAGAHPTKTLGGHLEMLLAQRVCVEIAASIRALLESNPRQPLD